MWRKRRAGNVVWGIFVLLALGCAALPARCDHDQGSFIGRVVDADTGEGVGGARVAVLDDRGHTAAWTTTDTYGGYVLPAATLSLIGLDGHHRHYNGIGSVVRGVGTVAATPFRVVGGALHIAKDAVGALNPVQSATSAAVGIALGSPVPFGAQVAANALGSLRGRARDRAVTLALNRREDRVKAEDTRGQAHLVVSAPQFRTVSGAARVYWLEPSGSDTQEAGAWLPSVRLAPSRGRVASAISDEGIYLSDPVVSPGLALPGDPLAVRVSLASPGGQSFPVRVFAQLAKTRDSIELAPVGAGFYAGTLPLDSKARSGNTTVTVVALRTVPLTDTGHDRDADPVASLAQHSDALDPGKTYEGTPLLFAGLNRLVIPITILRKPK